MDKKEYQRNYRQTHKAELNEKKKWYLKYGRIRFPMTEEERRIADKLSKDKYRETHREQKNEYNRIYRANNRDKIREHNKAYREANRDRLLEEARKHREANAAKLILSYKNYRDNNREKVREANRKWHNAHPEKFREYARNRRARKLSAPGRGITALQEKQLFEEYNYHCAYCGRCDLPLTVDHIEPLVFGGAHDIENATAACLSCNATKKDKTLLRFLYDRMAWSDK